MTRDGRTEGSSPKVVFAFDKFRGTASAAELVAVGAGVADRLGWVSVQLPLADGGEGSLEAVGGANKSTTVTGPAGTPVEAAWRMDGRSAFIEMAAASGLLLAGGAATNDPIAAGTWGTGQLIATAVELGARTVTVFLGGSATTDGGLGALDHLPTTARLKEIDLLIATDVTTTFVDAARVFGPQKGASAAEVELLERRLRRLAQMYAEDYGVDVVGVPGSGAAGGLAGGLLAVGGRIEPGFDVVAEWVGLDGHLEGADLIVTGEGFLDDESFNGKVVGGVHQWADEQDVPVVAIVGDSDEVELPANMELVCLTERFGPARSMAEPMALVAEVVADYLGGDMSPRRHK